MPQQTNATDVVIKKFEIYASAGKYNLEPHLSLIHI